MSTEITIKRVEGKSGGYWLASDGAWSVDGTSWVDDRGCFIAASKHRLAFKQLIDSEVGGEVEGEPETFTGDARDWGPGVYANEKQGIVVCVGRDGTPIGYDTRFGQVFEQEFRYGHSFTRLSTDPADFPKILAEQVSP